MPQSVDVIVVGGGAMGAASAYQLARRGVSVRLFEQFAMGHELGSSHGYSRIIRRAYFEAPDYVPLVDRAYELWRELEAESGESLLAITGIVEIGTSESKLLTGSALSCKLHNIPHERLSAAEIQKRFPQFAIPETMQGIWQKDAGILAVERCILTYRAQAKSLGALLHEEDEVLAIVPSKDGVEVRARSGAYSTARVVVCAGAWAGRLLADLKLPLIVARQPMGFYRPLDRELFERGRFPLFLMDVTGQGGAGTNFYGFPYFGLDCMKVAHHGGGEAVTPESVDRSFNSADDKLLRDFLLRYIPKAAGPLQLGKICLYTNTPDGDFILDRHPAHQKLIVAAGFSGHGFKFSSAIGEIMADLALNGATRHPIGRFKLARFPSDRGRGPT